MDDKEILVQIVSEQVAQSQSEGQNQFYLHDKNEEEKSTERIYHEISKWSTHLLVSQGQTAICNQSEKRKKRICYCFTFSSTFYGCLHSES